MLTSTHTFALSPAAVDEAASLVEAFCLEAGLERKDALRHRLSIEEVLLQWSEQKSIDNFRLTTGMRYRKYYIQLECAGLPCDPFADEQATDGAFVHEFRQNLGIHPIYSYKNGINQELLQFKTKQTGAIKAIVLSLLFAFAARLPSHSFI